MLAGGMAGVTSYSSTFPFDVIKNVQMVCGTTHHSATAL
jgi:hypothetical protein